MKGKLYFKESAGFTLIELLIVLAVLIIVSASLVAVFYTLTTKTDLDTSRDNVVSTLNIARNRTLASEGAAQYGVYFDTSTSPDRYVFFQGSDYGSRDESFDEIHDLLSTVKISSFSFNVLNDQVVFNRLESNTDNDGSVTIQSLTTRETRTIYVYSSGEISTQSESVSGAGRITDSRHVHFDLGWSIGGATTLKFDFINAGPIEQVSMVDYFILDGFDWEGEFLVDSVIQKFRVHTHQLNPTTLLCIHRDRNEGKNTEEVYIYIIQGGTEKEIAHYDDDEYATVYKGNYVWNEMEQQ